ncbi:5,6-dimethylbenzimidazole synthase [Lysobacter silvisoli]|uniref:5,6-dimethylbenzimidazole synthase n=1 Tax=Lysobacter silvisoli TaxID=2293254 RepID=A0A371K668_9GAMM|nr:5,6-dimethylbenzimidazole synthase [Lysobacter silvisoli]RDZ29368.1 5,6-dimethylbenzimidazole synthase [Lysobacter silvisoli]
MSEHRFPDAERHGVYRAIFERRDVRSQFRPDPVPAPVLERLLRAAHHAPSVGFMQPWDFVVIDDARVKQRVKALHAAANAEAANNYRDERAELYRRLKLEGIVDSPLNLCVTCDRSRGGEHVLGRNTMLDADLFSACLAVQNLWLAARAEGIGVGWVSILEPADLAQVLGLPAGVVPVAYLCLGYVDEFLQQPELQAQGWRSRLPMRELVHGNGWGGGLAEGEFLSALQSAIEAGDPPSR